MNQYSWRHCFQDLSHTAAVSWPEEGGGAASAQGLIAKIKVVASSPAAAKVSGAQLSCVIEDESVRLRPNSVRTEH